jgi:FkbM family methyltransferase
MAMKNLVTNLAARMGYTIMPTWRLDTYSMARCLRTLFAAKDIQTVIDVGANRGQYQQFLRAHVGFTGEIISFEPVPELAHGLQQRAAADPNWSVRACALGAAPGELPLNVTALPVFSSFRRPRPTADFASQNVVERIETVPVSTLDAEFPDAAVLQRAFLKLDTQGFDLEVMRGGREAARAIPALQSEVSFVPIYDGMPGYAEALAEFASLGFAVSEMFLVNKDAAGMAIDFDCVMVRRPAEA